MTKQELFEELKRLMKENKSFGAYAGNAFIIGAPRDYENALPFFDAKLVASSDETVTLEEYDIDSEVTYKVKRPKWIRVRFRDINGDIDTKRFDGFTSRFIQQMIDKLNGKSSRDCANRFHKEQADRRMKREQNARRKRIRELMEPGLDFI